MAIMNEGTLVLEGFRKGEDCRNEMEEMRLLMIGPRISVRK